MDVLEVAESIGYETPDDQDFSVQERTVEWKGGSYTFIYFELRVQWRLCVAIFEENSLKM